MKVFSFTEARQNLAEVLDEANSGDVIIKRRNGETFVIRREAKTHSPLDVPGITTQATMQDILDAVAESRSQ